MYVYIFIYLSSSVSYTGMCKSMGEIYIARGKFANIEKSLLRGVDGKLVEKTIGLLPQYLFDSYGRVHLWGIPESQQVIKYWNTIKQGDILIAYSVKSKTEKYASEDYAVAGIVAGKYPTSYNDNIGRERALQLSINVWEPHKRSRGRGIIEYYPYLIILYPNIIPIELNELLEILGITKKALTVGYRLSLQRAKRIKNNAYNVLSSRLIGIPEAETVYKIIEEAYVELCRKVGWHIMSGKDYGCPAPVGNEEIWKRKGLFELVNEKLQVRGYRKLTWNEFREYLRGLQSPEYYGRIRIDWILSPRGTLEPVTISIFEPIFL